MNKFLNMLLGQIKAGRDIIQTTLAIAGLDGYFMVLSYVMNQDGSLEKVIVGRNEEDENPITITTKNQEIAHYVCNPNPKVALPKEDISFSDGSLTWTAGGYEYETTLGSFQVDRVLGAFAGKIYLALESYADFTTNQVVIYDVQSDSFEERKFVVSKTAKMFVLSNNEAYIVNTTFEDKKVDETKEGQSVTKMCCTFNQLVSLTSDGMGVTPYFLPDDKLIVSGIKKSNDGRMTIFFVDKTMEGKNHEVIDFEKGIAIMNETMFTVPTLDIEDVNVFVGGKYNDVITVKTPGFMQVESTNGNTLMKTEDSKIVQAMDGFNIFCSQTRVYAEDGSYSNKITYADDAYENLKSVVVKATDRGDAINIA